MENIKDTNNKQLLGVDLTTITRRSIDNSYVIIKNNLPYHVPNTDRYKSLFKAVDEYATAHPEVVSIEYPYVPTLEDIAEQKLTKAKIIRDAAVKKITVEVDGMIFDGDEKAQERMARTITAATATGASVDETTTWVLHDNTIAHPTIKQLALALRKSGEEQTALWTKPYES